MASVHHTKLDVILNIAMIVIVIGVYVWLFLAWRLYP